ncbi:MAG: PPC domain-containing protein [Alkalispirochaeta sp.]
MKRSTIGQAVLMVLLIVPLVAGQDVIFSTDDTLGAGDRTNASGSYEDTFQVRLRENTTVEVIASSDAFDTYIEAVLPDGSVVSVDDYRGLDAGFLRPISTQGTMEIRVSSIFSGETGEYSVTVTELGEARTISMGETVTGTLGPKGGLGPAGRYQLSGRDGQRVVIDLVSDDFDAFLQVFDEEGQEFSDDDGGGDYNSRLGYRFDRDGSITIVATSLSGGETGRFELSVGEEATNVVAEYRGTLDETDSRGYDGRLLDSYEFDGTAGSRVGFALESAAFDAVLYVSNPDGTSLAWDDDSGGNGNSRIDVVLPETGTYTIYATSYFDGTGAYYLAIYE